MHTLATIFLGIVTFFGGLFGAHQAPSFGSYNPSGGGTYRLQTSIGTSNTSITLSSFKEPISNILYTMSYLNSSIEYGTIEPQSSNREFVSFTGITQNADGTATLTGVTRGISSSFPFTASTTLQLAHPGQSIFIISNSPAFYANQFLLANQVSTSTVATVFSSTTPPHYDGDLTPTQWSNATGTTFIDLYKLQATALAGTVNATAATNGVVQLATAIQEASSTNFGSSGASNVLSAQFATDTPQASCAAGYSAVGAACTVKAALDGFIKQAWIDLSKAFTFTGTITIPASVAHPLTLNSIAWVFPPADTASSTIWMSNGAGSLFERVPMDYVLALNANANVSSTNAATTSVKTIVIPANTITATLQQKMRIEARYNASGGSNSCLGSVDIGNGSASTTVGFGMAQDGGNYNIQTSMFATSTASQSWYSIGTNGSVQSIPATANVFQVVAPYTGAKYSSVDLTQKAYLSFNTGNIGGAETCKLVGYSIGVISQ